MNNPTMLYKTGSMLEWEGLSLDCITVDEDDVDECVADGWCLNPFDTKKKRSTKTVKPTESDSSADDQGG
ncbi:MAG: hypothetical protein ACEQSD_10100, partial [Flavobacteriales bacterium]